MRKLLVVVCLLVFAGSLSVFPQIDGSPSDKPSTDNPTPVSLTPEQVWKLSEDAWKNTQAENPELYRLLRESTPRAVVKANVGDTRSFTVVNISTNSQYSVPSTLRAKGTRSQVWVEDSSWTKGWVTQAVVNQILDNLEAHTGSQSLDPNKGIVNLDTEYFGNPPNRDGDGLTDFLILDVQDGWAPGKGYVAGFFNPGDQGSGNNCDILYLDCYPGIYYNGAISTDTVMATTAHEFQHLIHYNYDPPIFLGWGGEETWLNEAMSQAAMVVCGYALQTPFMYLTMTNNRIDDWDSQQTQGDRIYSDYSLAQMWALYLMEQYGPAILKQVVQDTKHGSASIDSILQPKGSSFMNFYKDWIVATAINDRSTNSKWGYAYPYAWNLRACPDATFSSYPANVTGKTVEQAGALFYRFVNGQNLVVRFTSSAGFAKLIRRGSAGTSVVDLTSGTDYPVPEAGAGCSEVWVVVGSTSGNASFTLAATGTAIGSETAKDDGIPDAYDTRRKWVGAGTNAAGTGWAVQLARPEGKTELSRITTNLYYTPKNSQAESTVQLHVWGDNAGVPGVDLVPPVTVALHTFWDELDVRGLFGHTIPVGPVFYVGVTHDTAESAPLLALDKPASGANYTWKIAPGQAPVAMKDLKVGDVSLAGFNIMMRATLVVATAVPGDVNADGSVDAVDLSSLQNHLAGNTVPGLVIANADCNGDGVVNAADLTTLATVLAAN